MFVDIYVYERYFDVIGWRLVWGNRDGRSLVTVGVHGLQVKRRFVSFTCPTFCHRLIQVVKRCIIPYAYIISPGACSMSCHFMVARSARVVMHQRSCPEVTFVPPQGCGVMKSCRRRCRRPGTGPPLIGSWFVFNWIVFDSFV